MDSNRLQQLIHWITSSMNNSKAATRSTVMREKDPDYIKRAEQEAEAARRVLICLRADTPPTTELGQIWFDWYVGWADCMILYYNPRDMEEIDGKPSRFHSEMEPIRQERDRRLEQYANKPTNGSVE